MYYIGFILNNYERSRQSIMSSNIPMIPETEDTVKDVVGNLKTDKQEASQTENENPISNDSDKDMELNKLTSLDKSWSSSRTET